MIIPKKVSIEEKIPFDKSLDEMVSSDTHDNNPDNASKLVQHCFNVQKV